MPSGDSDDDGLRSRKGGSSVDSQHTERNLGKQCGDGPSISKAEALGTLLLDDSNHRSALLLSPELFFLWGLDKEDGALAMIVAGIPKSRFDLRTATSAGLGGFGCVKQTER